MIGHLGNLQKKNEIFMSQNNVESAHSKHHFIWNLHIQQHINWIKYD